MKRFPDWERRLEMHFTAALRRPFQWGAFDCALAVCHAVAAVTGVHPGEDLEGEYESAEEATALMALLGGGITISLEAPTQIESESPADLGNLAAAMAEQHGLPEVRPLFARRGDVVLVNNSPEYQVPSTGQKQSTEYRVASSEKNQNLELGTRYSQLGTSVALGTVDLSGRFAWCVGERGFVRVPMARWLRAWHVGS